jgi:hypothetical protein
LFAEVGYSPRKGAFLRPWEHDSTRAPLVLECQVVGYEAVARVFFDEPWFAGAIFWEWRLAEELPPGWDRLPSAPLDAGYSPRGRPAEEVLRRTFGDDRAGRRGPRRDSDCRRRRAGGRLAAVIPALVQDRRHELVELCQRHRVRLFQLFGSAVTARFDPARSDLDFLVEFQDLSPPDYARHYFGLLHGLEDLFQRSIDLVTARSLTNPYLLRAIERERTVLYAA